MSTSTIIKRSKSQPPMQKKFEVELINEMRSDEKMVKPMTKSKKSKKKNMMKASTTASTIDNRPPFNLDTRIDGYDDVDDNGKTKRRWEPQAVKPKTDQDQLNRDWLNSLRGGLHES